MKLFYFSDPGFMDMKEKFENSIQDPFDKQFHFLENDQLDRNKFGGGVGIWKYKTEMILKAIETSIQENKEGEKEEIIVISDIDIVFYRPSIPTILECMIDADICFQKERDYGGINIGFMAIACNETTLTFWTKVYETLWTKVYETLENSDRWDQEIVNDFIQRSIIQIRWKLFPATIWAYSQRYPMKDMILHHANCVGAKEEKLQQMEEIRLFLSDSP